MTMFYRYIFKFHWKLNRLETLEHPCAKAGVKLTPDTFNDTRGDNLKQAGGDK